MLFLKERVPYPPVQLKLMIVTLEGSASMKRTETSSPGWNEELYLIENNMFFKDLTDPAEECFLQVFNGIAATGDFSKEAIQHARGGKVQIGRNNILILTREVVSDTG
ncbi:hypothetical protein B9Z55_003161 [Caenorhabditis nigoni]|uniref:Uncharacterized protein n=1 Tax=Caenorhabditis nigoni TaxID=1611254 RepID=A0A2G5VNX7_9PELO|nr:hypothetical protein B9Z55_003161 [Caenorhabditis nigoni]